VGINVSPYKKVLTIMEMLLIFATGIVTGVIVFMTYLFMFPTRFVETLEILREAHKVHKRLALKRKIDVITSDESDEESEANSGADEESETNSGVVAVHKEKEKETKDTEELEGLLSEALSVSSREKTGGYDLAYAESKTKRTKYMLSKEEERNILGKWNFRDMNYHEMEKVVETEGYRLHPIYYRWNPQKHALSAYDPKVIGVRISDPDPSKMIKVHTKSTVGHSRISDRLVPQNDTIIMNAVDVGGIDVDDHGIIKL
jgi:hypothetical protein